MLVGTADEHLELTELERAGNETPAQGDVRMQVRVRLKDFSGQYSGVWLAKPDLERFVADLQQLVENRRGKVRLESLTPGEFWVEIRSVDALGHFELEVQLKRYQYSGPTCFPTAVSGGFEIDPTQLLSTLSGFRAFLG
jgi:hypothetical protein